MRQRAVIAIALALNPPLMIMDEPTTALDVVVQQEIMQQIEELKEKLGFSILFITHDLSLLVEFSDRIAIMYAGEIVELAPAAGSVRRSAPPLHPGADEFVPVAHRAETATLTGIPGSPPDMLQPPSGCRFHPRCALVETDAPRIVPQLREAKPGHFVACHLYTGRRTPMMSQMRRSMHAQRQRAIPCGPGRAHCSRFAVSPSTSRSVACFATSSSTRWRMFRSRSSAAKSWRWSASRAAARARPPARSRG